MENGNVEMELEFTVVKKYGKSYDENRNNENCGSFSTKMFHFIDMKGNWERKIYDAQFWILIPMSRYYSQ